MPKILIGLPTYDSRSDTRQLLSLYGARRDNLSTVVRTRQLSALCWCFNHLWTDALNDKTFDYFLLLHADIIPQAPIGWIAKLIAEAETAHADLISVVSPIKNPNGLTSTALVTTQHPTPRRLTMHEIAQLPATFKAVNVAKLFDCAGDSEQELWINTGCMLMDLRRKRAVWESMHFRTHDDIVRRGNQLVATFIPEDWDFSRQAHINGLTVAATSAIKLVHNGAADYSNYGAWGNMLHDMQENTGV